MTQQLLNQILTFGPAFEERCDGKRLVRQMDVIREFMFNQGGWVTLFEIAASTSYPEASISSQLRHLRKARFGGYNVQKRRRVEDKGTWEYRISNKE